MIQRGDVVLARFPFTDRIGTKIRPVLVLLEIPGPHQDFLVMFISSQRRQAIAGVDVVLEPTDPIFAGTGLKTASVFKVAKVATLSEALLIGAIGRLDDELFGMLLKRLARLLQTGRLP
jgi:mRNA interferase MazF